jgi:hypothetical protein
MRLALLAPSREEVEHQLPALEAAVHCLTGLKTENPALRPEIGALRRELGVVRRLIDHAMAFDGALCRMLATAMGGYTASGSAAPLAPQATISVKG